MSSIFLRISILLFFGFASFTGFSQIQNPSFILDNQIVSYTIARYTPTWEIQPEQEVNSELDQSSELFRQVKVSQSGSLRSMIYAPGNIPVLVQKMNDSEVIDHWKEKRVRMYYRIRYKGYNVFLARINNHSSRSILPFRDDAGKWMLDLDFINDPLFECLQRVDFDPFTGKFLGQSLVNLSFDELEEGSFADYSGNDQKVELLGGNLAAGRIGRCLKVDEKTSLKIPVKSNFDHGDFHFDCHLNLPNVGLTSEKGTLFSTENGKLEMVKLTVLNRDGKDPKLTLSVAGTDENVEFTTLADSWFHLNITEKAGVVSVSVDGRKVGSVRTSAFKSGSLGNVNFGGSESAKFKLDELNIGL